MKVIFIRLDKYLLLLLCLFSYACTSIDIEPKDYHRGMDYLEPVSSDNSLKVKKVWEKPLGSGSKQEFSKLMPAVSEQAIFTVSAQGHVVAWEHKQFPFTFFNQKKWSRNLEEDISGGVFEGYGVVLVANSVGTIFALNSETGEDLWQQELEGEVLVPPQGNGRLAVVQMANGTLHGLDFRSGEKKWVYKTSVPSLTLRGTSIPVIEKERVYAGFANGKLVALNILTGTAIWESNIYLPEGGTELERVIDVDGNIVIDGERIFAATYQGKVVSLYKQNGRPLWKNNASNYLGLEKGLNQIYSVEDNGLVNAYNLESGELLWSQDKLQGRLLSAPSTHGNYLVLGDATGYVYWLRQKDGELVSKEYLGRSSIADYHHWNAKGLRNKANKPQEFRIFSKPVTHNGLVFIQNQFGAIAAYKLEEQE